MTYKQSVINSNPHIVIHAKAGIQKAIYIKKARRLTQEMDNTR